MNGPAPPQTRILIVVRAFFAAAGLWAAAIPAGWAQDRPVVFGTQEYTFTGGVREWITQGRSAHNIGTSGANVRSELTWRGANSVITEAYGDFVVHQFVTNLTIGYGTIGSGTLRDEDWDGPNRTAKFSETLSPVEDGHVLFISVTPGFRVLQWALPDNPVRGGVDLLLGYQFWRERYVAYGGQGQAFGMPVSLPRSPSLTQTNTWHSLRLGTRAIIPAFSFLAVTGSAYYIPVNSYRNEDIHHMRTDLRQDPSFISTATGGSGVQLDASVLFRLWRGLTFEAGYAYWDIRSGSGTLHAFFADGTVGQATHNEEHTRRHGVFFGLNWVF